MKLCIWLLMVGQFLQKRQIWVSEPHFGEVRGDAWPWLMVDWKARGGFSIRINWTFLLPITVSELCDEMTVSVCIRSFWHNTGVCWTDRQKGGFTAAYTALAKLALRHTIKNQYKCQPSYCVSSAVASKHCLLTAATSCTNDNYITSVLSPIYR